MSNSRSCPQCGAALKDGAQRCWLCGVAPDAPAAPAPAEVVPRLQFGIASLMLVITLIAVLLGVWQLAPGVSIALVIVITPAVVRATVVAHRAKAAGGKLGLAGKVMAFLAALALVVCTALAVGLAFYITCWGGFFLGAGIFSAAGADGYTPLVWGLWIGISLGVVVQLAFTALFIRWHWRRRWRKPEALGEIGFICAWVGFATLALVLLAELIWLSRQAGGFWALGLISLPGLVASLLALGRPRRLLASWGVGLGLAACGMAFVLWAEWNLSWELLRGRAQVLLLLLIASLAAALMSHALHYLLRRRAARPSTAPDD